MRASNKHDIVYFLEMQKELYSWSFPPPNQFFSILYRIWPLPLTQYFKYIISFQFQTIDTDKIIKWIKNWLWWLLRYFIMLPY